MQLAEQAKRRFECLGDRFGAAGAATALAELYVAAGRTSEAVELVEHALQEYSDVGTTQYENPPPRHPRRRRPRGVPRAALGT